MVLETNSHEFLKMLKTFSGRVLDIVLMHVALRPSRRWNAFRCRDNESQCLSKNLSLLRSAGPDEARVRPNYIHVFSL